MQQDTADRLYVMRQVGKRDIPELQPGPARIVIRAARPVLYGLRDAESEVVRDVEVRLAHGSVVNLGAWTRITIRAVG